MHKDFRCLRPLEGVPETLDPRVHRYGDSHLTDKGQLAFCWSTTAPVRIKCLYVNKSMYMYIDIVFYRERVDVEDLNILGDICALSMLLS